mmetsp:Transcript_11533/g.25635  ORF Transcript_11533/g.25635 Transcript_11533/m.25635 type:complete len:395 (+) Transcript_11533:138-1322(+)
MDDDYVGFSKEVAEQRDSSAPALLTSTPAPWSTSTYDRSAPPFVRLHNEILDCCEYIAPSVEEMRTREKVLQEVTEVVNSLWRSATISVFGSQMTKILTPTSDLDLVAEGVPDKYRGDPSQPYVLLAEALAKSGMVSYVEAIVNAKVPIVKLDHRLSGISVDICINNDSGLRTGKLIRRFVRQFPPLRPMVLVLKLFLAQRRLNDTYHGGIGSFLLTMMIVSFLQMKQRNALFRTQVPSWNLGTLLMEFFHLYGIAFNYYSTGLRIADGGSYIPKRQIEAQGKGLNRPNLLYVENPDVPDFDIGRNSFMMPKIRRSFEHAHQLLTAALADPTVPSYLAYVVRPDDPALQDRPGLELSARRSNALALGSDEESEKEEEEERPEQSSGKAKKRRKG